MGRGEHSANTVPLGRFDMSREVHVRDGGSLVLDDALEGDLLHVLESLNQSEARDHLKSLGYTKRKIKASSVKMMPVRASTLSRHLYQSGDRRLYKNHQDLLDKLSEKGLVSEVDDPGEAKGYIITSAGQKAKEDHFTSPVLSDWVEPMLDPDAPVWMA
jgi:hypothetical protein